MEILWQIVKREHDAGVVDEWIVFNNAYTLPDDEYTRALAQRGGWITVLSDNLPVKNRRPEQIHRFYHVLQATDAIYVRLDDDLVYLDTGAIPAIVRHKIKHPELFLVYPTIINNTRMSYLLQHQGLIPVSWGNIQDRFLEATAWRSGEFAEKLHRKAIAAIGNGTLVDEFGLADTILIGSSPDGVPYNHLSVNCFAIDGYDMAQCTVPMDEESYLSEWRPSELGRFNGIHGKAVVVHFAYHPQTEFMEQTGLLEKYYAIARNPLR